MKETNGRGKGLLSWMSRSSRDEECQVEKRVVKATAYSGDVPK